MSLPEVRPPSSAGRGLLQVPGYRQLVASSLLWHVTRWAGLFSVSYLLVQLADSPVVSQSVGALIFAPMAIGGIAAGFVTSRVDGRRLVRGWQMVLVPVEVTMLLLALGGHIQVWMAVPYTFLLGIGNLVNMTAQRALIYETAGPRFAGRAMTIEATSQAAAVIAGTLGYGALIDAFGIEAAFAASATLLITAALLNTGVPPSAVKVERTVVSLRGQLGATTAMVRGNLQLRGLIAVTVVVNLFAFGYQPLVPLLSREFSSGAVLAGALASAPAIGTLVGGAVLVTRGVSRRGLVLIGGPLLFMTCLTTFALSPVATLAFAALLVGGLGQACFGAMQALLSTDGLTEADRRIALGAVSTTIGVMLPLGMLQLGLVSELLGPRTTLVVSAGVGFACLLLIAARWPEFTRARAPEPIEVLA